MLTTAAVAARAVEANAVRLIRLGPKGSWAPDAIQRGVIPFGQNPVPHELARDGDRKAIRAALLEAHYDAGNAGQAAREIDEFYHLGSGTLWITFHGGQLWWAFAEAEVGRDEGNHSGQVYRRTIGEWSSTDVLKQPLKARELSGRLTQATRYGRTICRVKEADYVLDLINGAPDPLRQRAEAALDEMTSTAEELITNLHHRDFEILVDLVLGRDGWQRLSELGGTQAGIDLRVMNPVSGVTAAVQVKSQATQRDLDRAIKAYEDDGLDDRLIFAWHTAGKGLAVGERDDVELLGREALARAVVRSGLLAWLTRHV